MGRLTIIEENISGTLLAKKELPKSIKNTSISYDIITLPSKVSPYMISYECNKA